MGLHLSFMKIVPPSFKSYTANPRSVTIDRHLTSGTGRKSPTLAQIAKRSNAFLMAQVR